MEYQKRLFPEDLPNWHPNAENAENWWSVSSWFQHWIDTTR